VWIEKKSGQARNKRWSEKNEIRFVISTGIEQEMVSYLLSACPSHLEDLSNELIYEVFDYLDDWEIYEIFSQFNARFQRLFTSSSPRLKLNLLLTSKPIFLRHCSKLVTPNIDRIVSLSLSHYLTTNHFVNSFSIDSFIHLESLTLNGVSSNSVVPLLTLLATLPRFFSLSIICVSQLKNPNVVYRCIFNLPTIKYCKLTFSHHDNRSPLPYSVDKQDQCHTLEHLIIDSLYCLDQINAVLTYTPRLTHLSCRLAWGLCSNIAEGPAVLLHLTHITVEFYQLSFDELEMFLAKICRQLILLRVMVSRSGTFLCAKRWEQLILNHMPHLRIFDFQCYMSPDDPIVEDDDDDDNDDSMSLTPFDRFTSTFWCDRNWFFEDQLWSLNDDSNEGTSIFFYSTHPYR
jgi:hypothetical protein